MSEQSPNLAEQQPLNTGAATAPPHGSRSGHHPPIHPDLAYVPLAPLQLPPTTEQQQQWQQQHHQQFLWQQQQQQQWQQQQQQLATPPAQFYAHDGTASGGAYQPIFPEGNHHQNLPTPQLSTPPPNHSAANPNNSFGSFQPAPPAPPVHPPADADTRVLHAELARLRAENEKLTLAARIAALEAAAATATAPRTYRTRTSFGAANTSDEEHPSTEPPERSIAPLPTATINTLKTLGGTLELEKIEHFLRIFEQRAGSHDMRVLAMLRLSEAEFAITTDTAHRTSDAWLANTLLDCLDHASIRPQNLVKSITKSQMASGRALLKACRDTTVLTTGAEREQAETDFDALVPFTAGMKPEQVEAAAVSTIAAYKRLARYNPTSLLDIRLMLIGKLPSTGKIGEKRAKWKEDLLQADILAADNAERLIKPWSEVQLVKLIALLLGSGAPPTALAAEKPPPPPPPPNGGFDGCLSCGGPHKSRDCPKKCKTEPDVSNCPCCAPGGKCIFTNATKPKASEVLNAAKRRVSSNVFKYLMREHKRVHPQTYAGATEQPPTPAGTANAATTANTACAIAGGAGPRLETYCGDACEGCSEDDAGLLVSFVTEPYASAGYGSNPSPPPPARRSRHVPSQPKPLTHAAHLPGHRDHIVHGTGTTADELSWHGTAHVSFAPHSTTDAPWASIVRLECIARSHARTTVCDQSSQSASSHSAPAGNSELTFGIPSLNPVHRRARELARTREDRSSSEEPDLYWGEHGQIFGRNHERNAARKANRRNGREAARAAAIEKRAATAHAESSERVVRILQHHDMEAEFFQRQPQA